MIKRQDDKHIKIVKDTLAHFPKNISADIRDFVINDVLIESRYIFTIRKGKKQLGFCTHCKHEFEPMYTLKHKTRTMCPNCNSRCKVQAAGYGRTAMIDEAYFTFYEKSKVNKEAIIARGIHVRMDFREDYKKVEPEFNTEAYYLFEMDNPVLLTKNIWAKNTYKKLEARKSVFSLFKKTGMFGQPIDLNQRVSIDSVRNAIKSTPFQYSQWEEYNWRPQIEHKDFVEYFALYAKHPQIEYLMKLGLEKFVENKLNKRTLHRSINWQGKTLNKVLKVEKQDVKEIINHPRKINPFMLALYQIGKKDGSNLPLTEAERFDINGMEREMPLIKKALKTTTLKQLSKYLVKQQEKMNAGIAIEIENQHTDPYGYINATGWDLREIFLRLDDYWDGCKLLELEIGKDIPKWPSNLGRAHDNVYKQIKFKRDQELDEKIKTRAKKMAKFEYENEKFLIRPFLSTKEIIEEGKQLKHCVGGYSDRYANGNTDLFAIRKKSNPKKPYYTLEMKDGKVRQYYGYENNTKIKKSKEIIEFVNEFEAEVLKKQNAKKEIAS